MNRKIFPIFIIIWITVFVSSCKAFNKAEDSTKLYLAAVDEYSKENYTKSLAYIDLLKKHDSGFYQADFVKGKILFFQNDYDNALKIFKKLSKKYPQFVDARIWYARTLILTKHYDEAETFLEKELSYNQSDWRIYYLYSVLEEARGHFDKKIIMLNRAELSLTDSSKVYMELSQIWDILDMNDRSSDYFFKAKIVSGTNASVNSLQEAIKKVE